MPSPNSNIIDQGIGYSAREQHSYGRPTPQANFGNFGIHVGIVADDIDEMKMNRVHVYVPGVSAYNPHIKYDRYTNTREPMKEDGTPGAQIPSKRLGFIMAHPTTPSSGSDRTREPNNSDGRNSKAGESNSYGFMSQARNGDMMLVCFAGGDAGQCYQIGHIPKTGENDMIPGLRPSQTTASGSGVSTNVGPAVTKDNDETQPKQQTVFFNNLTDSGLIQDPQRGGGSSSATRETPSRVTGMKTAGDPDTNMMGHQFVMDDHPDSQLIRLRTSKGAQLLLSDTGNFIYMSSGTGKFWMEGDDSGNLHVYAHSSINYHTEQDFNLHCDRDFNLHVAGNTNIVTEGKTRIRMASGGDLTVGESGGDLDITTMNNFMVKTQKEIRMGAQTGITAKSADFLALQSAKDMTAKSAQAFNTASQSTSMKSDEGMLVQTGQAIGMKAGTSVSMKAAGGNLNLDTSATLAMTSGSASVDDAKTVNNGQDPNQADIPVAHSVMKGPQTNAPPTSPQGVMKSTAAVVPHHEPWAGHIGQNPGHDSAVPTSSIPKLSA